METSCDSSSAATSGLGGTSYQYQAGGVVPVIYNEVPYNESHNYFGTNNYGQAWQVAQPAFDYAHITPTTNALQTVTDYNLWSSNYPTYFASTFELQGGYHRSQPPVANVPQPVQPSGGGHQHLDRGSGGEVPSVGGQDQGGATSEPQHDPSTSEGGKGDQSPPCRSLAPATSTPTNTANSTQEMDLCQTPMHESESVPNKEPVTTQESVPSKATPPKPPYSPISSPGQLSPSSSILNMDSCSDGDSLIHGRSSLLTTPDHMFSPTSPGSCSSARVFF